VKNSYSGSEFDNPVNMNIARLALQSLNMSLILFLDWETLIQAVNMILHPNILLDIALYPLKIFKKTKTSKR
jgi:hypothetical protein